eukprot:951530-Rhodomonas_salina.1
MYQDASGTVPQRNQFGSPFHNRAQVHSSTEEGKLRKQLASHAHSFFSINAASGVGEPGN